MDATGVDGWPEVVPWWVDAPTDGELAGAVPCTDPAFQLSVAEILLEAGLAGPGPDAQRLLVSLVGREVTRDDWLTAVQLWEAQDGWLAGQRSLAVLGFAGSEPVSVAGFADDEALVLELALGVGCSESFAYDQIATARVLSSTLVRTGDLLRAGVLSPYRARLIVAELGHLHPDVARAVEAKVLGSAAQVPTGRLRRNLLRHVKRLDRQGVNDRRVAELAEKTPGRRVVFDPDSGDGLMGMYAYLPPVEAIAMQHALHAAAGRYRTADGRGQDERETDALIGMVIGFDPAHPTRPVKPRVNVQVLVDLPTLLGLRDNDGELLGYGHLPAEVVRELADHASWQRLVFDPVTGHLLDAGTQVHDLPALSQFIALRDRRDRFPGGTRTAPLDLDHTVPHKPKHDPAAAQPTPAAAATGATPPAAAPSVPGTVLEDSCADSPDTSGDLAAADHPIVRPGGTLPTQSPAPSTLTTALPAPAGEVPAAAPAVRVTPQQAATAAHQRTDQAGGHEGSDRGGGHTSADNLAALSRRHHRAKTFLNFTYTHLGHGVLEWTTPLGRTYTTHPHDYRPEAPGDDSDTGGDSDPPGRPALG